MYGRGPDPTGRREAVPISKPALIAAIAAVISLAAPGVAGARSVYVANSGSDTLGAFTADRSSGALSPSVASTVTTGTDPQAVVLTPDGKRVYVAATDGTISGYKAAADGTLSAIAGSPFPAPADPTGLTATSDGRFLYATSPSDGKILGFSIGSDGALTALAGSPFPGQPGNAGIASSPDAGSLYTTVDAGGPPTIFGYSIGADGALTALPAAPAGAGAGAGQPAFTPDGDRLYAPSLTDGKVYGFAVGAGGALSPLAGSPFTAGTAVSPGLAIAPDGKHLFETDSSAGTIAALSIDAAGSLGPVAGSPFPAGANAAAAAVSPDGRFLYAANGSGPPNVRAFGIDSGGALAALAGSPYDSGGTGPPPRSVAITPNQGPKANLTVIPQTPGLKEKTQFKGDSSTDPDGEIVSYLYDFGDGKSKTGTAGKPKVSHKYKRTGSFTVTMVVVDDEGCSVAVVYSGQTASCNGGPRAVATKQITVTDQEVEKAKLEGRERQKLKRKKVKVKVKAGANEKVTVVGTGRVKIKGKRAQALRKVIKTVKAKRTKALKLKPRRNAANRRVRKALRAGLPVKAKVQVKFKDEAGNKLIRKLPAIELR